MEATITLKLPCKLTKQEMKENDKALKEALLYLHSLEDRLDCELDEVKYTKRTLKEQRAKTTALQLKWENGEEERDVECEIRYNTPKPGQKIMIRKDTNKQVGGFSLMTDDEKNDLLNQPAQHAQNRYTVKIHVDEAGIIRITIFDKNYNCATAGAAAETYKEAIEKARDLIKDTPVNQEEVYDWDDQVEHTLSLNHAIVKISKLKKMPKYTLKIVQENDDYFAEMVDNKYHNIAHCIQERSYYGVIRAADIIIRDHLSKKAYTWDDQVRHTKSHDEAREIINQEEMQSEQEASNA